MHQLATQIIRKKNPAFTMNPTVSLSQLVRLVSAKAVEMLRALRVFSFWGISTGPLFLGKRVRLINKKNISLGKWTRIEDYAHLETWGQTKITLGERVRIGAFSRLITCTSLSDPSGYISIGNNVGIGEFAYLGGAGGLEISDDCIIGQYLSCHPENHNFSDIHELIRNQGVSRKGIFIGRNCWIGSKVTILDGVSIGDGCVIAAGAVVTTDIPANSVIGGVPAKIIKTRIPE